MSSEAALVGSSSPRLAHRLARLRSVWGREPLPLVTAYVVSGLLAVIIPAAKYRSSVKAYQQSYYYQYQQNNNNGENNGEGSGDHYEIDVNNCKWWQWRCTPLYMNENGEYVEQDQGQDANGNYYTTPSWFSGWGGNRDEGSADRDNVASNSGALKFVYAWQLVLFLGLVAYGGLILFKFRGNLPPSRMALQSLFLLIFVWMNTSFLSMWMLANGSIYTEGREIEELGGFYNQFSVMMFLTNFWYTIWSAVFCLILGIRICCRRPAAEDSTSNKALQGDSMNYLPYCEPSITVTGVEDANNSMRASKLSNGSYFF